MLSLVDLDGAALDVLGVTAVALGHQTVAARLATQR